MEAIGEGLALQLAVKAAHTSTTLNVTNAIYKLKKGERLKDALHPSLVKEFMKAGKGQKKDKEGRPLPEEPKEEPQVHRCG